MRNAMALWLAFAGVLALATASGCARPASGSPRANAEAAEAIRAKLAEGAPEAAAEGDAVEATGTGWATIKGTFKFVGNPPARQKLPVDKDTEVCGKGAGILDNSLLVSSDGGIANVVLYARAKRIHESAQPIAAGNSATPLLFDQKGCMFLTHVVGCQVNQKVDIKNSDPIGHNTKIDPAKGLSFNQTLTAGSSDPVPYTPTDELAIPAAVSCSIHPWMRAYLLPRKDKYFAVTKEDGSFEIANLPAGEEIEVQVWHERAAGPNNGLVLLEKDLKWSPKGRFKVKLDADQTKEIDIKVPDLAFK